MHPPLPTRVRLRLALLRYRVQGLVRRALPWLFSKADARDRRTGQEEGRA